MRLRDAIRLAILLSALCLPLAVLAQGAAVRSGEHATFSRLVFPDEPGRTWATETQGQSIRIAFSEGVPNLDLSGIFELIPKDRLLAADFANGDLTLRLACDCPVRVSQIPSGHIVIDIEDALPGPVKPPAPRVTLPRMPLADLPLLSAVAAPGETGRPPSAPPTLSAPKRSAPQVQRHPLGRVPLLPPDRLPEAARDMAGACAIEQVARRVLTADPQAGLAALRALHGALLDGQDRLDPNRAAELAEAYLTLGWGAEARLVSASSDRDDRIVDILAAAFDGRPLLEREGVDPGCGPGTAVIALLTDVDRESWRRADETRLMKFLDTIPDPRMNDLHPRLDRALARIDRADLLVGLHAPPPSRAVMPPTADPAAGTDATAVAAAIASLENANAAQSPVDTAILENARALRPSVPPGEARDALDRALLEALILARRPGAAFRMIEDNQATPEAYVTLALAHLPPEEAAVFLVPLDTVLGAADILRLRLRDVFLDLGLPITADRFARPQPRSLPRVEIEQIVDIHPWLARDFAAMADTPPEDRSARDEIAGLIRSRNVAPTLAGDLAAADLALGHSRDLREILRRLVAMP